ncbi:uncharacterized protein LOC116766729 [Danaus plexippus]|uniref:Uncharacterized protein n=1 Tax=Danaus plexippus plexippus TaxID=278856 RepID=A0A212ESI7_DANPL|nr:uncharacterized protein LOC116766729 [Danaus plexippus]OWR44458.1 hypothetical protein KGM_208963 [Danaus plexippus plexippus]
MAETQIGLRERLRKEFYTYCAFCIAVSALPALAFSYVVVRLSKKLWLKLLSSRYPTLEFIRTDTVRSLLDTHRNQGIINVLLCIKGTMNVEEIRESLVNHVINRRDDTESLMFPRLRHLLVSCWGNYAWDVNVPFRLENHFIVAGGIHRGRPVNENNIQGYASDIISKYFPSDQPPWQFILIPCVSIEPKYYILVRVHHLLLTGKKSLNIGDLLLVEQLPESRLVEASNQEHSPLTNLFPAPSAIPELWEKINETLSNVWNEFISEYDPTESTQCRKSLPGIFHVAGMIVISATNAFRDITKKKSFSEDPHPVRTVTAFLNELQRECYKRNLTVPKILVSPAVTFDPRKWPGKCLQASYSATRMIFKLPSTIWGELVALNDLRTTGHVRYVNTLTWKYGDLGKLWVKATIEALKGAIQMYRAPANFWTNTIGADDGKRNILQTSSLCGRKVTSWSRPVSRVGMERAAKALGVSTTDIALFATTEALRAFFENTQNETPDSVLITARAACENFLYTFAEGNGKNFKKSQTGGMVCLSLPIGASPRRIAASIEDACKQQRVLAAAWAAQARCGALTRSVPSPLARLTLNVLSRRYAVSYAEINSPMDSRPRNTMWGQTVDNVIYWRPPQANISMSLTIIQYANSVQLAVMADARLTPNHIVPATRWSVVVEKLIHKIDQEICRITGQLQQSLDHVPTIIVPDDSQEELSSEDRGGEGSDQGLRPPSPVAVSPPPIRKRVIEK